jgi:fibronectin type 3 domain-containing protein
MKIGIKNKIIDLKKVLFVEISRINSVTGVRGLRYDLEFKFFFKPIFFIFQNTHKIKFRC